MRVSKLHRQLGVNQAASSVWVRRSGETSAETRDQKGLAQGISTRDQRWPLVSVDLRQFRPIRPIWQMGQPVTTVPCGWSAPHAPGPQVSTQAPRYPRGSAPESAGFVWIRPLHAQPLGQGRHGQQREHEQHQQRKAAAAAERAARLAVRAVRADRVKNLHLIGNQIVPGHWLVLLAMRADWGLKQRHGRQRQGGKCVTMRGRLYRGKPCLRAR